MRSGIRRWSLLLAPCTVLLTTGALAQSSDPGSAEIDFKKTSTLTPQETMSQSQAYVARMKEAQQHITLQQERAKKDKDIIKLNCVTDKLLQVKGHMAVTDQSMQTMNTSIARGDDGARQHEYIRISILYQKVAILRTEADNCIGEDISYVGDTKVDVEIDPTVPQEDPTEPTLPLPNVTRPPEATPFA